MPNTNGREYIYLSTFCDLGYLLFQSSSAQKVLVLDALKCTDKTELV